MTHLVFRSSNKKVLLFTLNQVQHFIICILLSVDIHLLNMCLAFASSDCNQVYRLNIGYIRSPFFPSNYPDNANCYYLIMNSDPATRIILDFLHFDLESHKFCNHDSVKIYDGNSTKATPIGRTHGFCGKRAPPTLTIASMGNSLLIVFVSSRWNTKSGFNATYRGKIALIYFISIVPELLKRDTTN